jgi:hypothetical protein
MTLITLEEKLANEEWPKTFRFYKEINIWYIDLPQFLEAGLGTKANLMMVAGADTLLDILSNDGTDINVDFSDKPFDGCNVKLDMIRKGKDQELLDHVGHAPVDYGAYYTAYNTQWLGYEFKISSVWLCPVTEYVFGGDYPKNIYIKAPTK